MSLFSCAATSDLEFAERRQEIRVVVRVAGRFSLASRRDRNGDRRQFACRAVNMSQTSMMLASPVSGPVGEQVIAYFAEFGTIQGSVSRVLDGGFVMRIIANTDERSRLLRKLIWLEQNKNNDVPDVRNHKRIVPREPISTLTFSDGSMLGCFVIDMSASGAAVSADIVPEIGSAVAVGKIDGRVVRHFAEGFAVEFQNPQSTAKLEQLIHRS
jgi:hypothetical protein